MNSNNESSNLLSKQAASLNEGNYIKLLLSSNDLLAQQSRTDILHKAKFTRAHHSIIRDKILTHGNHKKEDADSDNEDNNTQDSDCDGDELDLSLEVPLEEDMCDFKGLEETDEIADYLEVSLVKEMFLKL